jgi:hypothetical protein
MKNELIKIYDHFGAENQRKKAHEEIDELFDAIESGDIEQIENELVDCMMIPLQVECKYKIKTDFLVRRTKMMAERTLARIESGYYESEVK